MKILFKSHYILFIAIGLITTFIYSFGLYGPFLFDDYPNIINNTPLQFSIINSNTLYEAAFSLKMGPIGRPISYLSFAFNQYICGINSPFCFKLINLFLHLLNAMLFFLLIKKITAYFLVSQTSSPLDIKTGKSIQSKYPFYIALATSTLWLVHPFNLTTVLYVVQRMNELATLFTLLTILTYIHIRTNELTFSVLKQLSLLTLGFLFFFLGLASKENTILGIFYIFIIEIFCFKFQFQRFHLLKKAYPYLILLVCLSFIVILFYMSQNYSYRDFSLQERLLTEARVLWFYIQLILIPDISKMGLFHDDFLISSSLFSPLTSFIGVFALILLITFIIIIRKKQPVFSFGFSIFLLSHSLESTSLPLEIIHEHRNYFGSLFLIYIICYYLMTLNKLSHQLKLSLILLLFATLSSLTMIRSYMWGNEERLATWMYQHHSESSRTLLSAGNMLLKSNSIKNTETSLALFQKGHQLAPDKLTTTNALISQLYALEIPVPEELIEQLMLNAQRTFLTPEESAAVHTPELLCNTHKICHWPDEIYLKFLSNVFLNPSLRKGHKCTIFANIAIIKSRKDNYKEALEFSGKALECDPDKAQYHLNYANLLIYFNKKQQALNHILIAKELDKSEKNQSRVRQNMRLIIPEQKIGHENEAINEKEK
ncbi:MAG: hypothetical protein KZQ64_10860 [gamma proteobacterium symbiont of Bathyaustriella thionipta]|nr:hypothetical protein [gamma proteobacterium symbiont of Bathyaustriella thionipta]MCU7948697.1 hypothetical protein [gamma proteobacterium symbiont of Bathyaustriella thionipta]MCU7953874.1 hypothetical protein [gamma proteobacterium symbiont of Bathyaustriella thionipta]MCU7955030.1 hypothetical protein [gamma proteobacterium symbiont of Bathyaustriella thionipta]MCU7968636.1 hypothetical protein [gamma proteobacterium symbiont of Bathyaustriella thionipta]